MSLELGDDRRGMLADYVAGFDRERLVELVVDAAREDWRLRERLLAEARASRGEGLDLGSRRPRVDAAFAPYDDFVGYREAAGWAGEVDEVIDALEELCDAGHPDEVAALAEYAHRRADQATQYMDDSDGWLTAISQRLAELHLRACTEGDPDPVELARRLVDLELTSELDGFHRAAAIYAGVLGSEGLAEYQQLVEPRWRELQLDADGWSPERFTVREAMVGVVLASGDPDELIEVRRHDLKTTDGYLEIAEALGKAGRDDEAEAWARQGLDRFFDRSWQTQALRARVSDIIQDDTASRPTSAAGALVEILAHEGDVEGAWQAAAEHGCDQRMWLTLARSREDTHPLDAIGVYEREVFADQGQEDPHLPASGRPARAHPPTGSAGWQSGPLRGHPPPCPLRARSQAQPHQATRPGGLVADAEIIVEESQRQIGTLARRAEEAA